jgi:GNAT superfamily N-acetyltransferase
MRDSSHNRRAGIPSQRRAGKVNSIDYISVWPAVDGSAERIAAMWQETSAWLRSQGHDQWQYPPDLDRITSDVEQGTAYIVRSLWRDLGTITLNSYADPEFWDPSDDPDDALYAHRIIVLPSARGLGIGAALLNWAASRAEQDGKTWLRLDHWKTNHALSRYYTRLGFEHVRTVDLPHRRSGILLQRPAGSIHGQGPKVSDLERPTHNINGVPLYEAWGWQDED